MEKEQLQRVAYNAKVRQDGGPKICEFCGEQVRLHFEKEITEYDQCTGFDLIAECGCGDEFTLIIRRKGQRYWGIDYHVNPYMMLENDIQFYCRWWRRFEWMGHRHIEIVTEIENRRNHCYGY